MKQEDPLAWSCDFQGTEHPATARLRLKKEYIALVIAMKRENTDNTHKYLNDLLVQAKAELQHARTSENNHRMATIGQHVDEIVAYLNGNNINIDHPERSDDGSGKKASGHYKLEAIPRFLGEVKCLIDQWHASELSKVHDEVVRLARLDA